MIDLNSRLIESVERVRKTGRWVSFGGMLVMIGSVLTFLLEFMRLMHISRLPHMEKEHLSSQELEDELREISRENSELRNSNVF